MSNYEITLPDGRTISVDAPDEAGARQAATNFMMREPAKKKGEAGGVENFTNSIAQGMTAGLFDEATAAGDATVGPAVDWALGKVGLGSSNTSTAPNWAQRYDQNLAVNRAQAQGYADTHPVWDTAGKVTGAVATLPMLPKALLGGGGLVGGTLKAAGTGAGFGAATGFGEGEGGFENRAINAGKDAVIGGAVGGALHPLAMGAGALGNMAAESKFGRFVADKAGSGVNMMADVFDKMAPKVSPGSLSAAAPEGGQLPVSGFMADTADALRSAAPSADKTLEEAATRRIANAAMRGEAPGFSVPGFNLKLADLGEGAMPADLNPMTQRLAQTAYISPGGAPKVINEALSARNAATGERVGGSVRQAFGETNPAVLEAQRLRLQRGSEGRTDYAEAVGPDAPYVISPQMRQISQEAPAIQRAMDTITANAADRGVTLTPAQVAHRVKQQLAGEADAAFMSGRAVNKEDVGNLAQRWRTALHEANPAIREADAAWQAGTAKMDALDLGRQFMKQGTGETADAVSPSILAERIPRMTAEEAQAFLAGAADTLYVKANSGPNQARQVTRAIEDNQNLRHKLVTMLGEGNANLLFRRSMSERAFAGTDRVVRGGSDSMQKAASAADAALSGGLPTSTHGLINSALGKVADIYNRGRAGNESVREQIARQLTSMDPVANAEMLARIQRILAEGGGPRTLQRGVAFGATQRPE